MLQIKLGTDELLAELNWGVKGARKRRYILNKGHRKKHCKLIRLLREPEEVGKDSWSNYGSYFPKSRSVAKI